MHGTLLALADDILAYRANKNIDLMGRILE
jgi:hypothetical protein